MSNSRQMSNVKANLDRIARKERNPLLAGDFENPLLEINRFSRKSVRN